MSVPGIVCFEHGVLVFTVVHCGGARSFWSFLRGNIREVNVRVRSLPVSSELLGDYLNDGLFREKLQLWLNNLWNEKDRCIEEMLTS